MGVGGTGGRVGGGEVWSRCSRSGSVRIHDCERAGSRRLGEGSIAHVPPRPCPHRDRDRGREVPLRHRSSPRSRWCMRSSKRRRDAPGMGNARSRWVASASASAATATATATDGREAALLTEQRGWGNDSAPGRPGPRAGHGRRRRAQSCPRTSARMLQARADDSEDSCGARAAAQHVIRGHVRVRRRAVAGVAALGDRADRRIGDCARAA